jgi:hypothetical protein
MSLEETESAFSSKIRRNGGFASAFLPLLMVFALGLASAGAILLWISSDMPVFTNSAVAERVWSGQECEPGVPNPNPPECDTETWVRSMRGLSTSKWDYHDIGSGLIASALTLLAFSLCFHLRGERTLRSLRTPRHVGAVLAIFAASWLMQIPAFIFSRQIEIERRYGPPWADAQSMSTHIANFGVLVFLVPLTFLFWLIFFHRSRLPAPLWLTVPGRPWLTAFWTLVAALPFALFAGYLVAAHISNTALVPIGWVGIWVVLCGRAAALSRHLQDRSRVR